MEKHLSGHHGVQAIYARWLPVLALLLVTAAVWIQYAPSIDYGFLDWDDSSYIRDDAIVREGLGKDSLSHAFGSFDNPYFMPLTKLSLMLDVTLWGAEQARGFRLSNIVLHMLNCLLLAWLVFRASRQWLAAVVVCLLFAVHPQHVEAVIWIAGRKELLAGFFGLVSLCCYQQYARSHDKLWYLITLLAYGASLLNKPIWIVFPFLLLLWDFYPLQRIRRETALACIREKIPFLLFTVAYAALFNFSMQIVDTMVGYYPQESWPVRGLLPLLAMGKYLTNTFMPVNLVPFYAFPDSINILLAMAWLALIVLTLGLSWRIRHTYPGVLMACLWFGIALLAPLKISVWPQGEAIFVGDRYTYLAHIGLFVGLVLSASTWLRGQSKHWQCMALLLVMVLVMALVFSGRQIIAYWKTPEQLWMQTLERNPGKGQAYVLGLLGSLYHQQGRHQEALLAYQRAHEIYRQPFIYPLMVGSLLSSTPFRQYEESQRWLDKVLDDSPAPAVTLLEIGRQELANRRYARAEMFLAKAIERDQQQARELNPKEIGIMLALTRMHSAPEKVVSTLQALNLSPQEKTGLCRQFFPSGPPQDAASNQVNVLANYCYGRVQP